MGYRGADLDLRTSRAWSATSTDQMSGFESPAASGAQEPRGPEPRVQDARAQEPRGQDARGHEIRGHEARGQEARSQDSREQSAWGGSIWVDDTLLACANYAFDVALGHHAGEVRLEHLLFAMTRIEAAANAIEARGVPVGPLRRDAAMVVASEIPIGPGGPGATPRRSRELEEALRLAAAHAARSGRAASVEHVLPVLVDPRSDFPGSELLLRHLPRAARDFWGTPGMMRESGYAPASQFVDAPAPERYWPSPESDYLPTSRPASAPAPERQPEPEPEAAPRPEPEPEAAPPPEPAPVAAAVAPAASPTVANEEVLERLAQAETALSERLSKLETAIANAPPPPPPVDLTIIKDRLDVIEEALLARDNDTAVTERLSALMQMLQAERAERMGALSGLAAEVKALAGALGWEEESEAEYVPLIERLNRLASDLDQHRVELGSSLGDRIAQIEKALEAQGQKVAEAHNAYSDELAEVHDALMKLNNNQHTLAGSLDQWRGGESGEIHLINARIGAVQEDGVRRLQVLERLCADVEALSRTMPKESPRRDFRYWLFGTDDWIKASWMKKPSKPWLRHPPPKR
jgi:hypothetical protein